MKIKLSAFAVVLLGVVAMILASISHAHASHDAEKTKVMTAFKNVIAAYNRGDVSAAMSFYAGDGVFFESTIPFQLNKTALRKILEGFYGSVSSSHTSADSVDLQTSSDLAVLHCIIRDDWTVKKTQYSQTSRLTEIFVKEDGKWLIWNEHLSVPYDPATGKAVLNATP